MGGWGDYGLKLCVFVFVCVTSSSDMIYRLSPDWNTFASAFSADSLWCGASECDLWTDNVVHIFMAYKADGIERWICGAVCTCM